MQIEDEEDLELVGSVQSPSSYSLGFKKNFCRGIFALTAVFFILFIIVFSALSLIDRIFIFLSNSKIFQTSENKIQ